MGGELARAAYAASFQLDERGETLTMNERAVLVYMCTIAHDSDRPPKYWGGREAIARYALGRTANDNSRSTHEIVRRAIDGLYQRGAIDRIGTAYPGRSQEYAITLESLNSLPTMAQRQIGPSATSDWPIDNATLQMAQRHVGPETHKTNTQRKTTDHPDETPHLRPVENDKIDRRLA